MEYCPANSSLGGILQGDFNRCFIDTVTDPVLLVVALVAGVHQFCLYRNYSTPVLESTLAKAKSCCYNFQVLLHLLLPVLCIGGTLVSLLGYRNPVHGVHILNLVTGTLPWIITGVLVRLERSRQLPVSARSGHGPVLLIFWGLAFIQANLRLSSLWAEEWWTGLTDGIRILDFTIYLTNYLATCLVLILGIVAPGLGRPLFGMLEGAVRTENQSTWSGIVDKLSKLLPYLWPKRSSSLQLRVLFCVLLLILVRVANVFVPIYYKKIIDSLADAESVVHVAEEKGGGPADAASWPWNVVSVWLLLKVLQGGGVGTQGILNNLRTFLWIRVNQHITLEIQTELFNHIHSLSLRWHLSRKTGEVLRIMDRGTSSVNSLLQYILFNILPTLIDITVAVIYFAVEFNIYFGVIVFLAMLMYLVGTIIITEWRTKFRRTMNEMDNKQRARGVDSLLNAETVKYYSMEEWEVVKYKEAIVDYQDCEWQSQASLQALNLSQQLIIYSGLYAVSMYCAYLVAQGEHTVGDFVLLNTYFLQLMAPLNFLGTIYRVIQESFINMENMFTLMEEKVEVQDRLGAKPYATDTSAPPEIEFKSVSFNYVEEKGVLEDISFKIPSGTSVGIVGATGCGKSTVAKLMFRLFDPVDGEVLVNGVNIRDYTQHSFRSSVGVVPQDTVLFNDTIRYNLAYGRVDALQDDIEAAAKMADIHETILRFPTGYDTVVGERGLKLSGGEKQRMAIARTLLKNPNMVIFDEATSSLDTETERHIQTAIESVSKQRTSMIIAHRLSTIMSCEQILVLDQGRIVERGTHADLLQLQARYANLWNSQVQAATSSTTAVQPDSSPAKAEEINQ